jgi:hypothetical protein
MSGCQYCSNIVDNLFKLSSESLYVGAGLREVPGVVATAAIAAVVRKRCGQADRRTIDLPGLCAAFAATPRVAELGAAQRRREALLIPLPENKFGIAVDPTPPGGWGRIPQSLRPTLRRHRLRFRVAHELGHTFFYMRRESVAPKRRLFDSEAQESFCDLFSRNLLAPPERAAMVAPTPAALIEFQRECDVSLELAARAVAAARPEMRISLWVSAVDAAPVLQWSSGEVEGRSPVSLRELQAREPGSSWLANRRQLLVVNHG